MSYDPFGRGPYPVGVCSDSLVEPTGGRQLDVEVWYPAAATFAGQDFADSTRDRYELIPGLRKVAQDAIREASPASLSALPLVVFSHGFGSHRRQSSFLMTHLASHGYLVAAVDHTGNTIADVAAKMSRKKGAEAVTKSLTFAEMVTLRPADVTFVIDCLLDRPIGLQQWSIDHSRIGAAGHSFGGWTILTSVATDSRIQALLPLAPAGGTNSLPTNPLREAVRLDWPRDVPTLFLAADCDTVLPLEGVQELFGRTQSTKQMSVLSPSDHLHFCDRAAELHELFRMVPQPWPFNQVAQTMRPFSEFCPPEHAYDWIRSMGLAHFDAWLCEKSEALEFLASDLERLFADRGALVKPYS
jgi:predicted dienelactone hydrolase